MELTIRIIGLIVALLYVIFSIDDIIWDIAHFVKKRVDTEEDQLPLEKLDAIPPKLLAVIIAAWHEERVLELVIENMRHPYSIPNRCTISLSVYIQMMMPLLRLLKDLKKSIKMFTW
ncbi:MAG: hypothetical protein ACOX3N_09035 [Dethiobacteria bacterium]